MKKILLVEDNETIILGLKYLLEQENFEVTVTKSLKETEKVIKTTKFDLALLDVTLPDGNGFKICKMIKQIEKTAVIFLTARDEETNVVLGLDMGADDYVTKPFRSRELVSRINSVLRRYESNDSKSNILTHKDIKIDVNLAKVYKGNEEIFLTSLEYKILLMLFSNKDRLITREELLDKIWDIAGNFVNDNTLTVYIKRIREKLGDDSIIQTVRGLGYRLENE